MVLGRRQTASTANLPPAMTKRPHPFVAQGRNVVASFGKLYHKIIRQWSGKGLWSWTFFFAVILGGPG